MPCKLYCGSACVKYVLEQFGLKYDNLKKDMIWISELALCLKKHMCEDRVELRCYNSNLYADYLANKKSSLICFKYLLESEKNNIVLIEKELNNLVLNQEIKDNDFVILCVESKKFNSDNKMSGGHFIVLKDYDDGKVIVVNPKKEKYEELKMDIDFLVSCCQEYGAWRLLIKRRED